MSNALGLALGGGGAVGIAWEIGFLNGLEDAGVSVLGAEVVVGTSAGALVGAQVFGGRDLPGLLAGMEDVAPPEELGELPAGGDAANELIELFSLTDKAERGRRLGALALASEPFPEEMYLAMIGGLIEVTDWPSGTRFMPVGADCETGERAAWEAAPDVPLLSAVASSSCVPGLVPPVTIRGRRYIDGGVWSASNADLLLGTGVQRAVFIGPFGGPESPPLGTANSDLAEEVEALEAAGIPTVAFTPGAALRKAVRDDMMNSAYTGIAAKIGVADGTAAADRLRAHLEH